MPVLLTVDSAEGKLLYSCSSQREGRVDNKHSFPLGRSHGFVIGHVTPEAQVGGPIALVQDGDMIHIDAEANSISMDVTDAELERRRKDWKAPPLKVTSGTLYKYTKLVSDASQGCGALLLNNDANDCALQLIYRSFTVTDA